MGGGTFCGHHASRIGFGDNIADKGSIDRAQGT